MKMVILSIGKVKEKTVMRAGIILVFLLGFFLWKLVYDEPIRSVELVALNFPGRVVINEKKVLKELNNHLSEAKLINGEENNTGQYKLIITKRSGKSYILFYKEPGMLFETQTEKWYKMEDGGLILRSYIKKLQKQNPYGEFLTWGDVKKIFRRFDKAKVIDFETGKSFMVQYRAGSAHADVQPLTKEDTAVMKEIYQNRWSWKRRAVILEVKKRRIAASMNGMPHGAGAIKGNNFDGHFCIHFRDCKTHTGNRDLAHQMMIWKAAGVFDDMLADARPERILEVLLTAIEQGDNGLAGRLIVSRPGDGKKGVMAQLKKIRWFSVTDIKEVEAQKYHFAVEVSYGLENGKQFKNRQITFVLTKGSGKIPWKVTLDSVSQLFELE